MEHKKTDNKDENNRSESLLIERLKHLKLKLQNQNNALRKFLDFFLYNERQKSKEDSEDEKK